jgi:hypothetical protein
MRILLALKWSLALLVFAFACLPFMLGLAVEKARLVPQMTILEALQTCGENEDLAFEKLEKELERKFLLVFTSVLCSRIR